MLRAGSLFALLLLAMPAAAQTEGSSVQASPSRGAGAEPPGTPGAGAPTALRWFDEVRDQRRALAELRRAHRDAEQDARLDEFLRRRQERREAMEQERWLFMNYGPWLEPLAPPPNPATPPPPTTGEPPAGWDNRWYYNGW